MWSVASGVWEKIEPTGIVGKVDSWIGLERMDHVREFEGVADETGREVVVPQVPVPSEV